MVITKRMQKARMNQSSFSLGSFSAGRIGRSVSRSNYVRTRTVPKPVLVLTCGPLTYTLKHNSLKIEGAPDDALNTTLSDLTVLTLTDNLVELKFISGVVVSLSYDNKTNKPTSQIETSIPSDQLSPIFKELLDGLNAVMGSTCLA